RDGRHDVGSRRRPRHANRYGIVAGRQAAQLAGAPMPLSARPGCAAAIHRSETKSTRGRGEGRTRGKPRGRRARALGRRWCPRRAERCRGYAAAAITRLLPRAFEAPFAVDPNVRGDILFGGPIIDAEAVGDRARQFFAWLGWCPEVKPSEVQWPAALDAWQAALPTDDDRDAALLDLWGCLSREQGWDALPT